MGSYLTDRDSTKNNKCRIVVFGSNRARLQRVATLLRGEGGSSERHEEVNGDSDSQSNDQKTVGGTPLIVDVEYLPCIPVFGAYTNQSGERVRYLERVDFLGLDGTQRPPGTLLSFVDDAASLHLYEEEDEGGDDGRSSEPDNGNRNEGLESPSEKQRKAPNAKGSRRKRSPLLFGPISGAAVIDGLEEEKEEEGSAVGAGEFHVRLRDDVDRVSSFLTSILPRHCGTVPAQVMEPEPRFATLVDELAAFKALTADEKRAASSQEAMGPGKMARFVKALADRIVRDALDDELRVQRQQEEEGAARSLVDNHHEVGAQPGDAATVAAPPLDLTKNRYACRTCRFALFGDDDVQSPPHVPSRHHFSHKKLRGSHVGGQQPQHELCQSIFLQSGRMWMGAMSDVEGKLACPKCETKVGSWNWSGAQCSCGTWIVPAIQFPRSRVDVISPLPEQQHEKDQQQHPLVWGLPPGTVVSPVVVLQPLQVGGTAGHHDDPSLSSS